MKIKKSTKSLEVIISILTDFLANRFPNAPKKIKNDIEHRKAAINLYVSLCDLAVNLVDVATMLINAKENGLCAEIVRNSKSTVICEERSQDEYVDIEGEEELTNVSFLSFSFPYDRVGLEERELPFKTQNGGFYYETSMPYLYGFLEVSLKDACALLGKLKRMEAQNYLDFLELGEKLISIFSDCLCMIRFAQWIYKIQESGATITMNICGYEIFVVPAETSLSNKRIEMTPEYLLYLRMVSGKEQVKLESVLI